MGDELIDIYDQSDYPLGIQKMKSEAHKKGLWHRATHICIYNSKGEILLQLRAKDKEIYPNTWDISVAGHVSASEEPIISGLREIKEEIGLSVNKKDLEFFRVLKHPMKYNQLINNEFYYIYFLKFEGDINQLKIQKEELQKIEFFPVKKMEQELKSGSKRYLPQGEYWSIIIKEIKRKI